MNIRKKWIVLELWGLGDLMMAVPFLRAASARHEVHLLAQPSALPAVEKLLPGVQIIPFRLPWTAFTGKYRLHAWPWGELRRLTRLLRLGNFDAAMSVRWDPRDHLLMRLSGARHRLGFARLGSGLFLTQSLPRPSLPAHRYESWRAVAAALSVELPARNKLELPAPSGRTIVIHTGAAQPARVWPVDRYARLVMRLRGLGHDVRVLCDSSQQAWWRAHGEVSACCPRDFDELHAVVASARVFIGNDSGPGHLAAISGVPTFTIFGNQFPQLFAPLHPAAEWMEGKPCPCKPCYDRCRFPAPHCLLEVGEDEVWPRVEKFVNLHLAHG